MFAVIKTGGKQYKVAKDDVIVVERLAGESGAALELDQVLMIGDDAKGTQLGQPLVDGARVAATILDQDRADKIVVFKKKRRKNYRRISGHRQSTTVLRITEILAAGETAAAVPTRAPKKAKVEAQAAEAPAPEAVTETTVEAKPATKKAAPKKAAAKPAAKKPAAKPRAKKSEEKD